MDPFKISNEILNSHITKSFWVLSHFRTSTALVSQIKVLLYDVWDKEQGKKK